MQLWLWLNIENVDSQAAATRDVRAAIGAVASRLGNTPTVCQKCYIHPEMLVSDLGDSLVLEARDAVEEELGGDVAKLRADNSLVLAFLQQRQRAKR